MRLLSWRQVSWSAVVSTTATLFPEVYLVSLCANCSVFKIHKLSQIDTHGLVLFSKNSFGCQLNFGVFLKQTFCFFKFLHSGHPIYFSPHLTIRHGRYCTRYIHPDRRFLNSTHLYLNKKYFHLPDDVCSATSLAYFGEKKSYLFDKAFPP